MGACVVGVWFELGEFTPGHVEDEPVFQKISFRIEIKNSR